MISLAQSEFILNFSNKIAVASVWIEHGWHGSDGFSRICSDCVICAILESYRYHHPII